MVIRLERCGVSNATYVACPKYIRFFASPRAWRDSRGGCAKEEENMVNARYPVEQF